MSMVMCPHCGRGLENDLHLAGQVVACPHCGGQFQMPVMTTVPPMTTPTPAGEFDFTSRSDSRSYVSKPKVDSGTRVAAIIVNIFLPGVGQMILGDIGKGLMFFFGTIIGLFLLVVPGLALWIWSIVDAAKARR